MGIAENIDTLLAKYDITAESLARIADVTPPTVSRWRKKGAIPREDAIEHIASFFDLNRDDIVSDSCGLAAKEHGTVPANATTPKPSRTAYAPLLGRVHAGEAQEPDIIDDRVSLPAEIQERHPDAYFLEVEGNCMSKVYPEGCLILIDPHQSPHNGSVAVVSIDGSDYVMRKLYRGASTLVLSPDSWEEGLEDIVIQENDGHIVEFIGTVVWFQPIKELD